MMRVRVRTATWESLLESSVIFERKMSGIIITDPVPQEHFRRRCIKTARERGMELFSTNKPLDNGSPMEEIAVRDDPRFREGLA